LSEEGVGKSERIADVNPMLNVMQQMLSFVMKAEKKNGEAGTGG